MSKSYAGRVLMWYRVYKCRCSTRICTSSILVSYLYGWYINKIENQIRLFVDYTSLFVTVDSGSNSPAISLTNDLNKIRLWSEQWLVSFNLSKTVIAKFSRSNRFQPSLCSGNNIISECDSHWHLGLVFQCTGVCPEHVSNIYKKACQKLNIFRMLKYKISMESLIKIYFSFIRPVLEYADVVWTTV